MLAFLCFLSFPGSCDGVISCYFFRMAKVLLEVKEMSVLLIFCQKCTVTFILGQKKSITLKRSEEIMQAWIRFGVYAVFLLERVLEFVSRASLNSRDFY